MQLTKHVRQGSLLFLNQGEVNISISENNHYRWLAFDDTIQSVMLKRLPWKLTLPHQTILMFPLLFFSPKKVTELGLGGGNIARYLKYLDPEIDFTSIEYSATVIECFEQYFNPETTKVNIIFNDASLWLKEQKTYEIDWLICDIYQQQVNDFKNTLDLFTLLMHALTSESCLSLNLPDLTDQEVNLCLTVLQQLQSDHNIVYFHVPNYLNIIIHIIPKHWQSQKVLKRNKKSNLSKSTFTRWRQWWQHKKEINTLINNLK